MPLVMSEAVLAWNALRAVPGLGPKRLVLVARSLRARGLSGSNLFGSAVDGLEALGLPKRLAQTATKVLATPPALPRIPAEARVVCPDDAEYPKERLNVDLPLPVVLWAWGNVSLLKAPGIAIAGSRSTPRDVLELANDLSTLISKAGLNVVSGNAVGVDRSAHEAALRFGTTTAVLAEGLLRLRGTNWESGSEDSALVVSGFEPDAGWSAGRAMERNAHIASLADSVVIVAAGLTGGSWAQGQLCLKANKPLFVLDLPQDVAPGNTVLIEQGARLLPPDQLEDVLEYQETADSGPDQLGLLD